MAEILPESLPFEEAIQFFRQKLGMPTRRWTDVMRDSHDRAFVVAGAVKMELIEDLRAAVDRAIADGTTLQDFRKDFDRAVQRAGWSYRGSRGWRTQVIYQTNLRTAHAAGRYAQMTSPEVVRRRPLWQYRHGGAAQPRPKHVTGPPAGWNGLVLRYDDPFWQTHYPPNGWGCSCFVRTLSEADAERLDVQVGEAPTAETYEHVDRQTGEVHDVPTGVDFGWDYAPGARWAKSFTPEFVEQWPSSETDVPEIPVFGAFSADRPPARPLPLSLLLPNDLSDEEYYQAFIDELGDDLRGSVLEDVTGDLLTIDRELFTSAKGKSKINKRERGQYMRLLARSLVSPDEVWVRIDRGRSAKKPGVYRLLRRYLTWWRLADQEQPALVAFTWSRTLWNGVTAFPPDNLEYADNNRTGLLVYQRPSLK